MSKDSKLVKIIVGFNPSVEEPSIKKALKDYNYEKMFPENDGDPELRNSYYVYIKPGNDEIEIDKFIKMKNLVSYAEKVPVRKLIR